MAPIKRGIERCVLESDGIDEVTLRPRMIDIARAEIRGPSRETMSMQEMNWVYSWRLRPLMASHE